MKIGIVGGGVVGKATARTYLEYVEEVRIYDVIPERSTHPLDQVLECDLIFVCLPTPKKDGGLGCDWEAIDNFFWTISPTTGYDCSSDDSKLRRRNYVLRSTVPIGTTSKLRLKYNIPNLVHSPEFLTARCAFTDAIIPSRNIIGVPYNQPRTTRSADDHPVSPNICQGLLMDLYLKRFPATRILMMSSDESEAVKLFTNGFFSVKVAYFNEIRTLADKLGLNWDTVMKGILSDGRIAHSHTQVPGPDGKRGFGGACLPKDLANLLQCMYDAGTGSFVVSAALDRNEDIDRKEV